MKKLINYCAGALISILCVAFVGCNEPNEQEQPELPELPEIVGTVPVPAPDIPDEVAAFFTKHLPPISGFRSELFFVDDKESKCLIINSDKELQAIIYSSIELPSIDFDKHTLIVGQQLVRVGGLHTVKQGIINSSEKTELNLFVEPVDSYQDQLISILYYWGLYPKLFQKQVNVNVTYTEKKLQK